MDNHNVSWDIQRDYWYGFCSICIGFNCFKRFWFKPATPRHWPYSPVSMWHGIVDDNVEAAKIYRRGGLVEEPRKPHKNHVLDIEQEATSSESHCKQPVLSKGVPITGSLALKPKSREHNKHKWLIVRLRIWLSAWQIFLDGRTQWISKSPLISQHILSTWIYNHLQWDTCYDQNFNMWYMIYYKGDMSLTALNYPSTYHEQPLTLNIMVLTFLFKGKSSPLSLTTLNLTT